MLDHSLKRAVSEHALTVNTSKGPKYLQGEILEEFVNTLSGDGKYPVQDSKNLTLSIQMLLSEERKTFSEFFVPFLESASNFIHFERKDDRHS